MDVTNISSHLKSQAETSKLAPLVERLAKRADVNRDGNVTSEEFSGFLSQMMASLDAEHATTPAESHMTTNTPMPTVLPATATVPASTAALLRSIAAAIAKDR